MSSAPKIYGPAGEPFYQEINNTKSSKRLRKKRKMRFKGRRFVCVAIIAYLIILLGQWQIKINQADKEISALTAQKNLLLAKKHDLESQRRMVSSAQYVEKIARENLGLVKKGEKVLLLAKPGKVMQLQTEGKKEIYD
ncbi:septum formation initiator family protein [Bacillota bacterium LX-D]|nr:septum formation initiator family protein [Bacillota bacterium LX-D]